MYIPITENIRPNKLADNKGYEPHCLSTAASQALSKSISKELS
jgi:hypothetical protein